eukprot:g83391.t1
MQNAPAALRRLALPAYCKEVDINNSVPVFLLWLAESLAEDPAPLAALRELVENREECLRKTAEILGMSRDGAKEALLKVLHGGDLVGLPPCRFAQRLRNSVAYAIFKLKPHFRKIWDFCVKRRKLGWDHVRRINYKNTDGAFVHFVTTRYEALVMSRAMAFFRDRGCETICLRHDSLVIEDRQNVVDEATLRKLAEFCVAIDYGETETRPQAVTANVWGSDRAALVAPVRTATRTYMQEQEPRMQSAIDSDDDDDIALPSLRARARRRRRGAQQAAAATGGEAEECDSEPPSPTQAASDDESADEKTVVTGRGKAKKEAVYRFYELLTCTQSVNC